MVTALWPLRASHLEAAWPSFPSARPSFLAFPSSPHSHRIRAANPLGAAIPPTVHSYRMGPCVCLPPPCGHRRATLSMGSFVSGLHPDGPLARPCLCTPILQKGRTQRAPVVLRRCLLMFGMRSVLCPATSGNLFNKRTSLHSLALPKAPFNFALVSGSASRGLGPPLWPRITFFSLVLRIHINVC